MLWGVCGHSSWGQDTSPPHPPHTHHKDTLRGATRKNKSHLLSVIILFKPCINSAAFAQKNKRKQIYPLSFPKGIVLDLIWRKASASSSSCSNLTKWPVVDGEGRGDNVIRKQGNIKKPPRCWLCLLWEFDYSGQYQSAGAIKSSAQLVREGQVCGIAQEIWPQVRCPEPAGWVLPYTCWQLWTSGRTLCIHVFIFPQWHFAMGTWNTELHGLLNSFP